MNTIDTITVLGGRGKSGRHEAIDRIDLRMGDVVSIVGPTGLPSTRHFSPICRCGNF